MLRLKLIIPLAAVMLAMLAVAHIGPGSAAAQYPTPKGALLCSSGAITAQANSSFQFTATFVDITGAAVQGHTVFFSVSGGATLSSTSATTDGNGQASVTVNTGTAAGQIVVTANADQFVCRAVVNIPVEVPNIVCHITQLYQFNNQYQFIVTLKSTTTVLIGQTVNFYITSTGGGASLSQLAAITDGNGSATVIVNVLPTSGSVTVTANYNGMTCPATINVVPPPPPSCQPNQPGYSAQYASQYCFIQQVVPPVSIILPPQTGDAGLAVTKASRGFGIAEGLAVLGMLGMVSGAAVLSRQVREIHDVTGTQDEESN
jgi:hypothetical protein